MKNGNSFLIKSLFMILLFCCPFAVQATVLNEYFNNSWDREYKNTFVPDWSFLSSLQKTRKLFIDAHIEIPQDAKENAADYTISFLKDDAAVTLYPNGVMRTQKGEAFVEYYDIQSTMKCSLSEDGKLTSSHLDKKLQNSGAVAVEDGFVLCKSVHKSSDVHQRLNCQIRLQDGFSTTFAYHEDGTIVATESTGVVEILPPLLTTVESIMRSHGMLELPKKAVCTQAGVLCPDGNGLTCYALDGIFMRVTAHGTFNVNVPTQAAILEGAVVGDDLKSAWKKTSTGQTFVTSARLEGVDILFNGASGEACLSINPATFEIGEFVYDSLGHYCRRNGTGCLRYGQMNALLTYGGVCNVLARSIQQPVKSIVPQQHPLYARAMGVRV